MQPNQNSAGGPKPSRPRRMMDMYVMPKSQAHNPTRTTIAKTPIQTKPQVAIRPTITEPPKPKVATAAKTSGKSKDIERPSLGFIFGLFITLILLAGGGAAAYYFVKYKPNHKPPAAPAKKEADNTNHISDDTLGIKFAISKDLTSIDKAELIKQNPYFVYGFKQKDVPNVSCTISQQKRTPPGGPVDPDSLRAGSMKSIKKAYPDATQDSYEDISLVNGQDAASIVLHYTDQAAVIKERMVVVATKNNVDFVFCTSPKSLFDFYSTKFNPFFDSLEIY